MIKLDDDLHTLVLEAQPAAQRLRRDFTNEFRERLLAELAVHPGTYLITKAQRHKMVNEDGYFLITLGAGWLIS